MACTADEGAWGLQEYSCTKGEWVLGECKATGCENEWEKKFESYPDECLSVRCGNDPKIVDIKSCNISGASYATRTFVCATDQEYTWYGKINKSASITEEYDDTDLEAETCEVLACSNGEEPTNETGNDDFADTCPESCTTSQGSMTVSCTSEEIKNTYPDYVEYITEASKARTCGTDGSWGDYGACLISACAGNLPTVGSDRTTCEATQAGDCISHISGYKKSGDYEDKVDCDINNSISDFELPANAKAGEITYYCSESKWYSDTSYSSGSECTESSKCQCDATLCSDYYAIVDGKCEEMTCADDQDTTYYPKNNTLGRSPTESEVSITTGFDDECGTKLSDVTNVVTVKKTQTCKAFNNGRSNAYADWGDDFTCEVTECNDGYSPNAQKTSCTPDDDDDEDDDDDDDDDDGSTPTTPVITSVDPASGSVIGGNFVTIDGENLSDATTTVKFGSLSATGCRYSSSTGKVTCTVPEKANTTADTSVAVTITGVTGSETFQYKALTLTSLSVTSGTQYSAIPLTIYGTQYGRDKSKIAVKFGGAYGTVTNVNSQGTEVYVTTPNSLAAGTYNVTVTIGNNSVTKSNAFTFTNPVPSQAPKITNLTPSMGSQFGGDLVTVEGTNLSITGVTMGGVSVTCTLVTANTKIQCVTPAGTGTVKLRVTVGSNYAERDFSYKNLSPTFSPTYGSLNANNTVTITDSYFPADMTRINATTGVLFGGKAATVKAVGSNWMTVETAKHTLTGKVDVEFKVNRLGGTPGGTQSAVISNAFTFIATPTITDFSPTRGFYTNPKQKVTISGSNFGTLDSSSRSVKFGTLTATSCTWTAGSVECLAPEASSDTDQYITISGTTQGFSVSATSASKYNYDNSADIDSMDKKTSPTDSTWSENINVIKAGQILRVRGNYVRNNSNTVIRFLKKADESKLADGTSCNPNEEGTRVYCTVPEAGICEGTCKCKEVYVKVGNKVGSSSYDWSDQLTLTVKRKDYNDNCP